MTDKRNVFLRCTPLRSSGPNTTPNSEVEAPISEAEESPVDRTGLLRPAYAAHWQLECHGQVFEFRRTGCPMLPWNAIDFSSGTANRATDNPAIWYRRRIGSTTLPAAEVVTRGQTLAEGANYHWYGRNCQDGVIKLATQIIKEEDQDPDFKTDGFPTRLAEVVMGVGATITFAVTIYKLFPTKGPEVSVPGDGCDWTVPNTWGLCWEGLKDWNMARNGTGTRIFQTWTERVSQRDARLPNLHHIISLKELKRVPMKDLLSHSLKGLVGPAVAIVGVAVTIWVILVTHPELLEHLAKGWDAMLVTLKNARDKVMEWGKQAIDALVDFTGQMRDGFVGWLRRLQSMLSGAGGRVAA